MRGICAALANLVCISRELELIYENKRRESLSMHPISIGKYRKLTSLKNWNTGVDANY